MSRNICVYLDFLTDSHKALIETTARQYGFSVRFFTLAEKEEAREWLQECEILYAHSPEMLRAAPASLQWYCCAFAGVDPYCSDPTLFANPDCILTNTNSYGVGISEHVIMSALMLLRQMPQYQEMIRRRHWGSNLPTRSMRDMPFTILGTGDIGINVAKRLRGMYAGKITGLSRSGRKHPYFDEVLPISALDEVLPRTRFLIMALPGTSETSHILDRARIALLPRDAYVINVGRGSAIDQDALMEALNNEKLAGAALDVMVPEPLPLDHPLWETKNLVITPHISGDMTLGYTCDLNVNLFCADLANYADGKMLYGLVDRSLGY